MYIYMYKYLYDCKYRYRRKRIYLYTVNTYIDLRCIATSPRWQGKTGHEDWADDLKALRIVSPTIGFLWVMGSSFPNWFFLGLASVPPTEALLTEHGPQQGAGGWWIRASLGMGHSEPDDASGTVKRPKILGYHWFLQELMLAATRQMLQKKKKPLAAECCSHAWDDHMSLFVYSYVDI